MCGKKYCKLWMCAACIQVWEENESLLIVVRSRADQYAVQHDMHCTEQYALRRAKYSIEQDSVQCRKDQKS